MPKRLKLGQMLNTLPERLALARRDQLDHAAFLQILLADEVSRRDERHLEIQLQKAGFEDICRLEDFGCPFGVERRDKDGPEAARCRLLAGLRLPP